MQEQVLLFKELLQAYSLLLRREHNSKLAELIIPALNEFLIVAFLETLDPVLTRLFYGFLVVCCSPWVNQICSDYQCCASLTCMAMHQDFPTVHNAKIHNLDCVKASLETWVGQVFPEEIKERNSPVHQKFRGVRKTSLRNDTVSTVRMLTRFLQVEDGSYSFPISLIR